MKATLHQKEIKQMPMSLCDYPIRTDQMDHDWNFRVVFTIDCDYEELVEATDLDYDNAQAQVLSQFSIVISKQCTGSECDKQGTERPLEPKGRQTILLDKRIRYEFSDVCGLGKKWSTNST